MAGRESKSKIKNDSKIVDMEDIRAYIEEVIMKNLPEADGMSDPVRDAMVYAVEAGGKRIRPLLMYLTYKAFSCTSAERDTAAMFCSHRAW